MGGLQSVGFRHEDLRISGLGFGGWEFKVRVLVGLQDLKGFGGFRVRGLRGFRLRAKGRYRT